MVILLLGFILTCRHLQGAADNAGAQLLDDGLCAQRPLHLLFVSLAAGASATACKAARLHGLSLQVHSRIRGSVTRLLRFTEPLRFDFYAVSADVLSAKCKANFVPPLYLNTGDCLALRVRKLLSSTASSSGMKRLTSWAWRLLRDSDTVAGLAPTVGDLIKWPAPLRHTFRTNWRTSLPIRYMRRLYLHVRLGGSTVMPIQNSFKTTKKRHESLLPEALTCNSSNFDPAWSRFRSNLWDSLEGWAHLKPWAFSWTPSKDIVNDAEHLRNLVHLPTDGILSAAQDMWSGHIFDPRWSPRSSRLCVLGYLIAVFVVVYARATERLPQMHGLTAGMQHLETALFPMSPSSFWWLLDGSFWPIEASTMVDLLQSVTTSRRIPRRRPWMVCPCSYKSFSSSPATAARKLSRPRTNLHIAVIANHNYIFDVIIGLRETADAAGINTKIVLLGHELADRFHLSQRNCVWLGGICRSNARLNSLLSGLSLASSGNVEHHARLFPHKSDDKTSSGIPSSIGFSWNGTRTEFESIWKSSPELQTADLLVCGYPYPLCYFIDDIPQAVQKPVLLPLHGTIVSEYIDIRLQSWVFDVIRNWLHGHARGDANAHGVSMDRRWVVAMNAIEYAWLVQAFGHPVMKLPLAARYLRYFAAQTVGTEAAQLGANQISRRVLLHRFNQGLLLPDAQALTLLIIHAAMSDGARIEPVILARGFETWELLNFRAAVMVPWDWETTTFIELYRFSLPLFIPHDGFMEVLIWHTMRVSAVRQQQRFIRFRPEWWQGAPCHVTFNECQDHLGASAVAANTSATHKFAASSSHPRAPWLDWEDPSRSMLEQIRYWYGKSDYGTFPYVHRFRGVPDLVHQLATFDPEEVQRNMDRVNAKAHEDSAKVYRALLRTI